MRRLAVVTALAAALASPATGAGVTATRLRVGYVTSAGALSDRAIGEHMYRGFVRAVRELGVDGRVLVVSPTRSADAALSAFGRARYDLIIAGGFIRAGAVNAVALRFPRSRFFYVGGPAGTLDPRLRNVRGLTIHTEQAGYLAGYLAALTDTRRAGKDVVAAVGGVAQVPDVANYIGGYRRGARQADSGVAVLTGYSNDFVNPRKCRAVALGQIAADAGVVFQVAGPCGLGALQAAKERHVWGVGVDVDQSLLGPHILTSAVVRPAVAVYTAIRDLRKGTFKAGTDVVLTLGNGGVGLGTISPKVPASFLWKLETVRRQIRAGSITIPRVPG